MLDQIAAISVHRVQRLGLGIAKAAGREKWKVARVSKGKLRHLTMVLSKEELMSKIGQKTLQKSGKITQK